jgi:hypothetical protein
MCNHLPLIMRSTHHTSAAYCYCSASSAATTPALTLSLLTRTPLSQHSPLYTHTFTEPASLALECRDGLLLCRALTAIAGARFAPGTLSVRPLSRTACITNLEAALRVVWRRGSANNSRIPTAEQLYEAPSCGDKLYVLLEVSAAVVQALCSLF